MDNIYGNQWGSDNAFTRKARLLQSMFRVETGENEEFWPKRVSKRKYRNMISGSELSRMYFWANVQASVLLTALLYGYARTREYIFIKRSWE